VRHGESNAHSHIQSSRGFPVVWKLPSEACEVEKTRWRATDS